MAVERQVAAAVHINPQPVRATRTKNGRSAPQRNGSAGERGALAGTIVIACMPFLATLHALRDLPPQDEVAYVGAQLPTLLRGHTRLYYETWHPSVWTVSRSRSAFIERL